MSPFKREKWRLDVATERAALSRWQPPSTSWETVRSLALTEPIDTIEWGPVLENLLSALGGRSVDLSAVVDNRLARFFFVAPPAHIYRLGDLKQIAALRFKTLFARNAADWCIEAQWDAGQPFLACALPARIVDALDRQARRVKSPLQGLKPEVLTAIEACAPAMHHQKGWLVYESETHAMVAHLAEGRIQWLSQWLAPATASPQSLIACVKREAIKSGCDDSARIYVTGARLDQQHWLNKQAGDSQMTSLPDKQWRPRDAADQDEASKAH